MILLTRTQPHSQSLQAYLQTLGIETMIFPLQTLEALPYSPINFKDYQGVIVTSQNALQGDMDWKESPQVLTVGEATSSALEALGASDVIQGPGTAEDLIKYILQSFSPQGKPLLYLRGEDITTDLKSHKDLKDYKIEERITYRMNPTLVVSPSLIEALKHEKISGVTFFSKRNVEIFDKLMRDYLDYPVIGYCLSSEIAQSITNPWITPVIASRPTTPSLLKSIEERCHHGDVPRRRIPSS